MRAWADEVVQVPPRQTRAAKLGIHRQYEFGTVEMALVQNAESGHGSEDDQMFFSMVKDVGPAKALQFREPGSDESITQV